MGFFPDHRCTKPGPLCYRVQGLVFYSKDPLVYSRECSGWDGNLEKIKIGSSSRSPSDFAAWEVEGFSKQPLPEASRNGQSEAKNMLFFPPGESLGREFKKTTTPGVIYSPHATFFLPCPKAARKTTLELKWHLFFEGQDLVCQCLLSFTFYLPCSPTACSSATLEERILVHVQPSPVPGLLLDLREHDGATVHAGKRQVALVPLASLLPSPAGSLRPGSLELG